MTRDTFEEMVRAKATDYQRMQIANALTRVRPDDLRAFEALGGILEYKGPEAVLQVLDLAAKVVPTGSLGSTEIQASTDHAFPAEAWAMLRYAMRMS